MGLLAALTKRFGAVSLLMDCYTEFAARASRYKNPVNEVGVTRLWGVDDPRKLERGTWLAFLRERGEKSLPPVRVRNARFSVLRRWGRCTIIKKHKIGGAAWN